METRKFGIFGPFSHVPKNRVPRGRLGLPKGSRSMFLELPGVQIWLLSPRLCSKSPSLSHSVSSVRPTSSRPCLPQARAATCLMLPPSQACLSWQGFMDLFPVGVPSPRSPLTCSTGALASFQGTFGFGSRVRFLSRFRDPIFVYFWVPFSGPRNEKNWLWSVKTGL